MGLGNCSRITSAGMTGARVDDQPSIPESVEEPAVERPSARKRISIRARTVSALVALMAVTVVLAFAGQRSWFWIDEGLSVGISSHQLAEIPELLRQDASPPLYYVILHGWMKVFGRSEVALHALSLLFAVATVPVAFWAGRSLFGRRAGWTCALLACANPYLTRYASEARMYTLMALLALAAVAGFLHAFAFGRRRYIPLFIVSLGLLLYTHNWALFLALGLAVSTLPCALVAADKRRLVLDSIVAFGLVGLAYLPWLPTLLHQAGHTAAPWSGSPLLREAIAAIGMAFGDERALVALLLTAGLALGAFLMRPGKQDWAAVAALVIMLSIAAASAWVLSQFKPSWTVRYFGIFVPPLLLLAGTGLSRDGRRGILALVLILLFWTKPLAAVTGIRITAELDDKANVKRVATQLRPLFRPGDLVISPQIEQVPVLAYYFPPGLRYATPLGAVADPGVVDWSDAQARLSRANMSTELASLLEQLPVGNRAFLVCPRFVPLPGPVPGSYVSARETGGADTTATQEPNPLDETDAAQERNNEARRKKPSQWFGLVVHHCLTSVTHLSGDARVKLVDGPTPPLEERESGASVYALAYEKRSP